MSDNVLFKYDRHYAKHAILDGVTSAQQVIVNSATWGATIAGRVTVTSAEIPVTAPAATATSAIQLTPYWLGPPSSVNIAIAVASINVGVGFQLKTVTSVGIATVSFGAAWTIFNPA